ncbi:hypothetical protein BD626DRAFT_163605 [Schizophyllum amplum]|uniref:Uncharacterized protein n=1 Tax=Schizophyllum amplum TaxID=97359 RepID=A0A550CPL3_9AGAR|nr:hypothetical protein BD626DRAFT_163605 [Auriculariopsis ampla]
MSVFLVVEDSSAMQRLWPTIRDRGVHPLLESLQRRTPVPMTLAVSQTTWDGLAEPQHFNDPQRGLSDFYLRPDAASSVVSAGDVQSAIQRLAQMSAQRSGSGAQHVHLIVAAASAVPQPESTSLNNVWTSLATEATRVRILPHLVLGQGADSRALLTFFTTVVRLQNAVEDATGSRDAAFSVRTSTRDHDAGSSSAAEAGMPASGQPSLEKPRPKARRTVPDAQTSYMPTEERSAGPSSASPSGSSRPPSRSPPARARQASLPEAPRPSIVSQLQQLHGLSKKRVYGAKPARRPFIRGEEQRGSSDSRSGQSRRGEEPRSEPTSPARARYAGLPAAPAAPELDRESVRLFPAPQRREHRQDTEQQHAPQPPLSPSEPQVPLYGQEVTPSYGSQPATGAAARGPMRYTGESAPSYASSPPSSYMPTSQSSYEPATSDSYASAPPSNYVPLLPPSSYGPPTTSTTYSAAFDFAPPGTTSTSSSYEGMSTSVGHGVAPPSAGYSRAMMSAGYGPAPPPPDLQPWAYGPVASSSGHDSAGYSDYQTPLATWTPSTYTSAPPSPRQGYAYLPFNVAGPYATQSQQQSQHPKRATEAPAAHDQLVHRPIAQPCPSASSTLPPSSSGMH